MDKALDFCLWCFFWILTYSATAEISEKQTWLQNKSAQNASGATPLQRSVCLRHLVPTEPELSSAALSLLHSQQLSAAGAARSLTASQLPARRTKKNRGETKQEEVDGQENGKQTTSPTFSQMPGENRTSTHSM